MKRIFCFLMVLAVVLSFAACGKKESWRSDVPVSKLCEAVEKHLDGGNLAAMTESYLQGNMKLDTSLFSEFTVKINAYGANVDEYGIFKAPDEAGAAAVKKAAEAYLQMRKDTWMEEYMPQEKPKLTKAAVKVCGLYVIYVIVGDDVRQPILDEFEKALKA